MFAFVLIHYSMARARARIAPKSRSETHHPMKLLYAPVIVSLALFAGCAKNSDVAKLQSQLRKMQDQQLELTSDLQGKLDATQGRLAKVEADLEQAKTSASELKDTVNSNKETEIEATITRLKDEAELGKTATSLVSKTSKTEEEIYGKLVEGIGKNLNTFPPAEWWEKHRAEDGFNRVGNFVLALTNIQGRATKADLFLTDDKMLANEEQNRTDLLVVVGLARLYDQNPDAAKWVASFWVKKAMIFNQLYLNPVKILDRFECCFTRRGHLVRQCATVGRTRPKRDVALGHGREWFVGLFHA